LDFLQLKFDEDDDDRWSKEDSFLEEVMGTCRQVGGAAPAGPRFDEDVRYRGATRSIGNYNLLIMIWGNEYACYLPGGDK
jgi:hypothetical protein